MLAIDKNNSVYCTKHSGRTSKHNYIQNVYGLLVPWVVYQFHQILSPYYQGANRWSHPLGFKKFMQSWAWFVFCWVLLSVWIPNFWYVTNLGVGIPFIEKKNIISWGWVRQSGWGVGCKTKGFMAVSGLLCATCHCWKPEIIWNYICMYIYIYIYIYTYPSHLPEIKSSWVTCEFKRLASLSALEFNSRGSQT